MRPTIFLRQLRIVDIVAIARLTLDKRFTYPALTGNLLPGHVFHAVARALVYVLRCVLANRLGAVLFGQRLHWIMAIVEKDHGFVGVVMIDELVRFQRKRGPRLSLFLKRSDLRLGLRQGDGEIGIFLKPEMWGRGAAADAIALIIRELTATSDEYGLPLLRRVWAETDADNTLARKLLDRLGLEVDETASTADVHRYSRDGHLIKLVHYRQNACDEVANPECPALCVTRRLDAR